MNRAVIFYRASTLCLLDHIFTLTQQYLYNSPFVARHSAVLPA